MFTPFQLKVLAKILRICLAYESREVRIRALRNQTDAAVAFTIAQLTYAGYLGTEGINLKPE